MTEADPAASVRARARRRSARAATAAALFLGAAPALSAETSTAGSDASVPLTAVSAERTPNRSAGPTGGTGADAASGLIATDASTSSIRRALSRMLERVRAAPTVVASDCRWPDARALAAILPVATDRGSHASGVVVASGRVLTAAHAVADGGRSFVRLAGGYRAAELLLVDRDADIAVLAVDTYGIAPLPIALDAPAEDQPVWAVGYPREAGRTTSSGVFKRTREGALHTSAPIDSGQSGGGLLVCERGAYRLLGMLRGYGAYRSGSDYVKLTNHSVAVAAGTIHRVLAGGR